MKFRTLRADEIDVRVGSVSKNGATLLLYKDARCDQNILDETVGEYNWQRHHSRDNANCIVSIWDKEKNQWIEKEDTGTESYTEKEKGLASDSFKRACFNWGIGRELYTAPFCFVKCETIPNGKGFKLADPFIFYGAKVSEIEYFEDRKEIKSLKIVSKDGKVLVNSKLEEKEESLTQKEESLTQKEESLTQKDIDYLIEVWEADGRDVEKSTEDILSYYGKKDLLELTQDEYAKALVGKLLKK